MVKSVLSKGNTDFFLEENMMNILETRNLKKYYGKGDTLVKALDGVDLNVEDGEFVAIVGTSGSGKSTLLHMLGGLDRPTSGTVIVDGKDIFSLKDEALTIFRRRRIGFVFQSFNLVPVLTVRENIVLPIQLDGGRVDENYVSQVVAALGLEKKLNNLPGQLSGGQQQRVAIALTAVLFTSLFTIALSINEGFQQSNFRQAGGFSHGGFKYITEAQAEALRSDPLIAQWGERRFLGMPAAAPFNKSHVEVSYADANEAHWMYCDPIEGSLPEEGTDQAATDTRVLELLGIEPEIGAKFTLTFDVDGHETTQTFTLCGWWEYDEAIVANHVLVPESRVDTVLAEVGVDPNAPEDTMTGVWNLDVMLKSGDRHIEQDLNQILANHGYQSETAGENYINIGVNWGYTGARISDIADPTVVVAIAAMALLIIFTGYLIIYNVFQISVAGISAFTVCSKPSAPRPGSCGGSSAYRLWLSLLSEFPSGLRSAG